MWARSLELVQLKKELEAVLYKTVAEEHAQPQALANYVKQNIPADYSNPSMLKMVEDAERNAKLDRFANPVIRELARLIVFRLSHGMRWPDRGENPQSDRFVADSADTILMIISWMAESRMFGMADRDAAHVVALLKPITQNERDFLGSRTPLASRIASDRQITNVFERLSDSLSYTLRNEPAGQAPPAPKQTDQK